MDYTFVCLGQFSNNFRCLIKCPDRKECEAIRDAKRIDRELKKLKEEVDAKNIKE